MRWATPPRRDPDVPPERTPRHGESHEQHGGTCPMTTRRIRLSFPLLLPLSFLISAGGALAEENSAERTWLSSVSAEIEASEYEGTWQTETALADLPSAWHAPNRAQAFRTYFAERGIRVIPRMADAAVSWEWGLSLIGYGRGGTLWPVPDA